MRSGMARCGRWGLVVALAGLAPTLATAADRPGPPDLQELPPVLDSFYRHRSRHQLELGASIGNYLGAHLKKSWITGARAHFHLNSLLALGAAYGYSRHAVNVLGGEDDLLRERDAHYLTAEVAFATDLAMRVGRSVILMDLSTRLGAGARQLNGEWGPLGLIGGGVKFYTGLPWLAVRIDVNNYLHSIPLSTGRSFDVDLSFALGVAFFLPSRPSPFERR